MKSLLQKLLLKELLLEVSVVTAEGLSDLVLLLLELGVQFGTDFGGRFAVDYQQ